MVQSRSIDFLMTTQIKKTSLKSTGYSISSFRQQGEYVHVCSGEYPVVWVSWWRLLERRLDSSLTGSTISSYRQSGINARYSGPLNRAGDWIERPTSSGIMGFIDRPSPSHTHPTPRYVLIRPWTLPSLKVKAWYKFGSNFINFGHLTEIIYSYKYPR